MTNAKEAKFAPYTDYKAYITLRKGMSEDNKRNAIYELSTWLWKYSEEFAYNEADLSDAELVVKDLLRIKSRHEIHRVRR